MQKQNRTQEFMFKSKKVLLFFVFASFLFALSACEGAVGPEGPAGPAGPQGVQGEVGPAGPAGQNGVDGQDGLTPYVGDNGNWFIGNTDTGISAAGQDGQNGIDGQDGVDGQDGLTPYIGYNDNWFIGETDTGISAVGPQGETGLSAYDIYVQDYAGYTDTEAQWIKDLAMGDLVKTLTVEYNNGVTEQWSFLKGEMLGVSPYAVNWYTDSAFTQLADNEYITDDMTVYINIASDDIPSPVLDDVFYIDQVNTTTDSGEVTNLELVSNDTVFTLSDNVFMYDANGDFVANGLNAVSSALTDYPTASAGGVGAIFADVTVVNGVVVELRLASDNLEVVSSNKDIDVDFVVDTTTGAITTADITMDYGTTVHDLLVALAPADGRDVALTVLDDSSKPKAVTTGTTVIDHDYTLKVLAENESDSVIYRILFNDSPDNAALAVNSKSTLPISITTGTPNILNVRPGMTGTEVLGALVDTNDDYPVSISMFNSEYSPKAIQTVASGDKVVATSIDGTKVEYVLSVAKSNDVAITYGKTAITASPIHVAWNSAPSDVLAAISSTNNEVQTYALQYWDDSLTTPKWVAYDATNADQPEVFAGPASSDGVGVDPLFQLVVTAEDGTTTQTYTFYVDPSKDATPVVADGYSNIVTAIDNTNKEIHVAYGVTLLDIQSAIVAADGSELGAGTVTNSAGTVTRGTSSLLYTGDVATIVAQDNDPANNLTYTIVVNAPLAVTSVPVNATATPSVIKGVTTARVIQVLPNVLSGGTIMQSASLTATTFNNLTANLLNVGMSFQTWDIGYYDTSITPSTWVSVKNTGVPTGKTLEDLIVKVTAQDGKTKADFTIDVLPAISNTGLSYVTDYRTDVISSYTFNSINVFYQDKDGVVISNISDVMVQFNLAANFERYEVGVHPAGGTYTTTIPTGTAFDDLVVRVYAENYVAGGTTGFQEYAINYVKSTSTNLTVVDTPDYIDNVSQFTYVINVFPEDNYVPVAFSDIVGDLNPSVNYQTIDSALYTKDASGAYVGYTSGLQQAITDDVTVYLKVTAQDATTVKYYAINVYDKLVNTAILASDATGAIDFTVSGSTITVPDGTTASDLLASIDVATNFQQIAITANDGSSVGAKLVDNDIVTITAQDDTTTKVYTIKVSPVLSPDTTITVPTLSTTKDTATTTYIDTVTELLASLQKTYKDTGLTFQVLTSEGTAKLNDKISDYDILVVTAEDGTTTQTYVLNY